MWYVQALSLLKKNGEVIPLGLLNNIGVLHFERGELEVKTTCSCIVCLRKLLKDHSSYMSQFRGEFS